jgi:hypothetical protein
MKLPTITNKQQEILKLLYKYRFLNRIQIQALMNHKDYKTINVWLKDLRKNHYAEWIYNKDHFAEKTKPAIYYLGLNGIRFLKTLDTYPLEELRKRYRESTRSQTFIDRCLLLADCCISLEQARDEGSKVETWFFYETEADYLQDSFYHFLADSELIHPHLCFSKEQYEGGAGEPETVASYLLEIFDPTFPRYRIKKRLSNYVEYLDEEAAEWTDNTKDEKLPHILLVCSRTSDLIYAKRRTRGLIADIWESDDENRPHIQFTTAEKLKAHGIPGKIWEKA